MPTIEESGLEANSLLLAGLENSWKNYRVELKHCRNEFSKEAVHDLRVSTRRLLALLQLLHSISPRPRLQKMIRSFKEQLDELDGLRDVQVLLAEISEIIQELPQLQAFQKYLRYLEEKILRTLRKKIKIFETSEISKRIRKTHEWIEKRKSTELETYVMQAVDDAYLLTKIHLDGVDPGRPATIHRVRIAFKSFRYIVEIIHPLLKGFSVEHLKRMNDYQSWMGEIQDTDVFIQTFDEFSEYSSFSDQEPVCRYYELRHAEAMSTYVESMDQLYDFWRPAPNQPFPWEKPNGNLPDPSL